MMDVYLVPVGAERYELYCEVPDEPDELDEDGRLGFFGRMRQRFRDMLSEAERNRRQPRPIEERGWLGRLKARSMRWVAESIAEQRLLWHLRRQTEATLFYPHDLDATYALSLMRSQMRRDFEKHRFWLIVDSIGFVASGLLMLIPGPNLLAYYFAFRCVGHFFSLRGARQALSAVHWRSQPSQPLTELRRAIALDPEIRVRRVHEVAVSLRLEHLATFFERAAIPSA
jgi:hypothetical protein